MTPYTKTVMEVLATLGVDPMQGLSQDEVNKRQTLFGENNLQKKRDTFFQ